MEDIRCRWWYDVCVKRLQLLKLRGSRKHQIKGGEDNRIGREERMQEEGARSVPQGAEECPHGGVLHEGLYPCLQYQHLCCDRSSDLMSERGGGVRG
jgi:hypothetical protein